MSNERPSENEYRPRSPDLPSFPPPRLPSLPKNDSSFGFPPGYSFSPRGSYDASPYFSPQTSQAPSYFGSQPHVSQSPSFAAPPIPPHQYFSNQQYPDEMARLRSRKQVNYDDNRDDATFNEAPTMQYPAAQPIMMNPYPQYPMQHPMQQPIQMPPQQFQPPLQPQLQQSSPVAIDVRTKFPVARIKRIMQADEDVGKVAQATPTAVAKALEQFMISLVTKGARDAKAANSKRVTASHLKQALLNDPQFDFLKDICENVPDETVKKAKTKEAASDDSASDVEIGPAKKKAKGRRKKTGDDSD